jgi:hypothetical protein
MCDLNEQEGLGRFDPYVAEDAKWKLCFYAASSKGCRQRMANYLVSGYGLEDEGSISGKGKILFHHRRVQAGSGLN